MTTADERRRLDQRAAASRATRAAVAAARYSSPAASVQYALDHEGERLARAAAQRRYVIRRKASAA